MDSLSSPTQNIGGLLSTRMVMFHQTAASRLGLNASDFKSLLFLADTPMKPSDLAAQLGLTTGALTVIIDRLAHKSLVVRIPDPHDRRQIRVQLTPGASAKINTLFAPMAQTMRQLMATYTQEQQDVIADFCLRSADVLHQETLKLKGEIHNENN